MAVGAAPPEYKEEIREIATRILFPNIPSERDERRQEETTLKKLPESIMRQITLARKYSPSSSEEAVERLFSDEPACRVIKRYRGIEGLLSIEDLESAARSEILSRLGSLGLEDLRDARDLGLMKEILGSPSPVERAVASYLEGDPFPLERLIEDDPPSGMRALRLLKSLGEKPNVNPNPDALPPKALAELAVLSGRITEDVRRAFLSRIESMSPVEAYDIAKKLDSIADTGLRREVLSSFDPSLELLMRSLDISDTDEWRSAISSLAGSLSSMDVASLASSLRSINPSFAKILAKKALSSASPEEARTMLRDPDFNSILQIREILSALRGKLSEGEVSALKRPTAESMILASLDSRLGYREFLDLLTRAGIQKLRSAAEEIAQNLARRMDSGDWIARDQLAALAVTNLPEVANVSGEEEALSLLTAGPGEGLLLSWYINRERLSPDMRERLMDMAREVLRSMAKAKAHSLFGRMERGGILAGRGLTKYEKGMDPDLVDMDASLDSVLSTDPIDLSKGLMARRTTKGRRSLFVLLDASGSMAGDKIVNAAVTAATMVMAFRDAPMGVVMFTSNSYIITSPENVVRDVDEVLTSILEVRASGGTMMGSAFEWALERASELRMEKTFIIASDFEIFDFDRVIKACRMAPKDAEFFFIAQARGSNLKKAELLRKKLRGYLVKIASYRDLADAIARITGY